MRKLRKTLVILALGATALCGLSFVKNASHKYVESVVASEGNYYQGVDTSSRQNLLSSLEERLNKDAVDLTYDGLWNAYPTTDVKPGTNILWDMYSNESYKTNDSRINKNYTKEGDSVNREHSIPQSWFNEKSPMKSDLFHVYPTDGYVNNRRGNYPFGEVSSATYTSNNGSKLGSSSVSGISGTVFEPIDEYKGDFARTYFYFATRYASNISGFSSSGKTVFSSSFPHLTSNYLNLYYKWHTNDPVSTKEIDRNDAAFLLQKNRNPYIDYPEWVDYIFKGIEPANNNLVSLEKSGSLLKTTYYDGEDFDCQGLVITAKFDDGSSKDVTSFVKWTKPTFGSNSVTGSYTHNGTTKTVLITGLVVNESRNDVESVSLDQTSVTLKVNDELQLVPTVLPVDAANKNVNWFTSSSAVATVSSTGLVKAVSIGTATITVKTVDGGYVATCRVTVTNSEGGDNSPVQVTLSFRNSETSVVDTAGNTWSADASCTTKNTYLALKEGGRVSSTLIDVDVDKPINVNAVVGSYGGTQSSINIYIINSNGTKISNTASYQPTNKNEYNFNCSLSLTDKSSSMIRVVFEESGGDSGKFIRFFEAQVGYTPNEVTPTPPPGPTPKLNSIDVQETLSIDIYTTSTATIIPSVDADEGAQYSLSWSSSDETVATVSGDNASATIVPHDCGETEITVTDGTLSAVCLVSVTSSQPKEDEPFGLEITNNADKLIFDIGDEFNYAGLSVSAIYLSGKSEDVTNSISIVTPDLTTAGEKIVNVSYLTLKTSYKIQVVEASIKSLDIVKLPAKTTYFVEEEFSPYGMKVSAKLINDTIINDVTKLVKFSYNFTVSGLVEIRLDEAHTSFSVFVKQGEPTAEHKAVDFTYVFDEKLINVEVEEVTLNDWNVLEYEFNCLTDETKQVLKNTVSSYGRNEVGAADSNSTLIKKCVERYDEILLTHKDDGFRDFMERNPQPKIDNKDDLKSIGIDWKVVGIIVGIALIIVLVIVIPVSVSKSKKKQA